MDSPARDHVEREVKLTADLDLALPDLREVVGGTFRRPERELRAAYFDTPDFRLWERGITLRHRTGEEPGSGTWTLKLPEKSKGPTLDRTELSWAAPREEVPAAAQRLIRGLVRSAELRQVAELETVRRPLELHDRHGRPWAVLDDDTVTVHGGPRDGLRFRQVEVELAGVAEQGDDDGRGGHGGLDAVVDVLKGAGARPDDIPKVAIALGLPAGERPDRIEVDARSSLGTVVRASIDHALDGLLDHDYRLRLHPGDPAELDIHQARVATRRLRSDLQTYRAALDPIWVRHTRDDLKWLGAALGSVRDLDVLRASLSRRTDGSPIDAAGQRELLSHLAEERRVASRQLDFVLEGDRRYLLLLDRLYAARQTPPFRVPQGERRRSRRAPMPESRARKALPPLVGQSWRSVRKEIRRAGHEPTNPELHRIRIKAKQLRYASEAAAPVIGKPARRTAAAAEAVQTVLGDHHDAVGAEEWLWNEALGASPWGSFAAGQLTSEQRRRQHKLARRWQKEWKRLKRRKVRAWLD
jgi:CHAD domain-containing protein